MKSILFLVSLLGLSRAHIVGSATYTVTVVRAEGLPDEDMDTWFTTNKNDVYVEVFGYGSSDDEIKEFKTSTIDGSYTPEWNEQFTFDEASDDVTGYTKFLFKLYDSDMIFGIETGADYLGETGFFETSVVTDCNEIFSEDMPVSRDDKEQGLVFIEVTKDGCESSEESSEESEESQGGGKSGGGEGKPKRLLL